MKTQSNVVLAVCGGYFFFQLLYYTLTLWHLVAKDKEGFRAVIWFLLRSGVLSRKYSFCFLKKKSRVREGVSNQIPERQDR